MVGMGLLGVALVLGGCNVFGGLVPSPDSVDALADDAETALDRGNTARAVRLFERAFEQDSSNVRVRVGLGSALYADRGLDVFALRRAVQHLVESAGGSGSSGTGRAGDQTACTDAIRPASSGRYDAVPLDTAPIQEWVGHASVIERVRRLVVAGALGDAESGFSSAAPRVRRKGFVVGSVTAVADGVVAVAQTAAQAGGRLFLDAGSAPERALIACASTEADLRILHGALCRLGDAARQGEQWLRARDPTSDEPQSAVLTGRLRTLDDALRARIDCS